jgi:hypothetical protein
VKAILIPLAAAFVIAACIIVPGWFLSAAMCNATTVDARIEAVRRLAPYATASFFGPVFVAGGFLAGAILRRQQPASARIYLLTSAAILCAWAGVMSYRAGGRGFLVVPVVLLAALAVAHITRGWNVRREALLLLAVTCMGFSMNAVAWASFQRC